MGTVTKATLRGAWRSWTMWVNGIALGILPVLDTLKDSVPQLERYMDAQSYKTAMLVLIASNIALRIKTTTGLKDK